jgi:hypothetical protein
MVNSKMLKLPIIIIISTLILTQVSIYAEENQDTINTSDTIQNVSDTSLQEKFPEKLRPRKPWEYVVSLPLWIATGPLYLAYRGIAATIGFVDDHNIPQTIERFLISEDGTREIMPDYSSRTGIGVSYSKTGLITQHSELYFSGSYWLLHRNSVSFRFDNIEMFSNLFYIGFHFNYEYVPDEPFFGIGPATSESSEMNYTHRGLGGSVAVGKQIRENTQLKLEGSLNQHKVYEGKNDEYPSIGTEYHSKAVLAGLMAAIIFDSRDRKGHPTKGTRLEVAGGFQDEIRKLGGYDRSRNTTFGFTSFSTDLQQYIHLPWSTGRILVLRAAFETKDATENKVIPFYLLSELGSDETIRGFSRDRYRDKDAVLASAEYRYPIWEDNPNSLDAFIFVDAGQVSDFIFENFKKGNTRFGYGLGFRFYNDEKDDLMAKISFGFSKERFRVVFALDE